MEIAALSRPLPGEHHNGDGYLIAGMGGETDSEPTVITSLGTHYPSNQAQTLDTSGRAQVLMAVIDGVGHGAEAAVLTEKLIDCVRENLTLELDDLVRACHQSIKHSRGAAVGFARVDKEKSSIDYLGVGNVRIQVGPPDAGKYLNDLGGIPIGAGIDKKKVHEFVTNNGIVGYTLPSRLTSFRHEYQPDDMIVMFTDGIEGKFSIRSISSLSDERPAGIAKSVMSEFGITADDATVVVAA